MMLGARGEGSGARDERLWVRDWGRGVRDEGWRPFGQTFEVSEKASVFRSFA
jgi:hypothetical protein